ncbi:hypothetical protein GCM10011529_24740 [Polymorphobacter glacialis]|uniref:Type II toxin-antitoxin system RelE/ParE family toxin n=1 Tax=Sandarakinorhabdus glacialis TaxID=1614636 RepID=A0A916ZXA4_9SPHN|nr:type II toxin-antitoxin system RelE/ParE family toxin [Polymorphobacter glacialis]GGE17268.1 hypothetical protein GCM10011529_24740 [Polymorphobacter glacialis]
MTLLRWAPRSLRDIRRIEIYLDSVEPVLAGRIIAEIERRTDQLVAFPLSGPAIGEGRYRKLTITRFNYIIVYRVVGEWVEVVRVRHAHVDWLSR